MEGAELLLGSNRQWGVLPAGRVILILRPGTIHCEELLFMNSIQGGLRLGPRPTCEEGGAGL